MKKWPSSSSRHPVLLSRTLSIFATFMVAAGYAARSGAQTVPPPGALDPGFQAGQIASGRVCITSLLQVPDGGILAGGISESEDAVEPPGNPVLARLEPDGSVNPKYDASSFPAGTRIRAILVDSEGQAIVAGGPWANNPVRFTLGGAIDTNFQCVVLTVESPAIVGAMAMQPDGKSVIAGSFDSVNRVPRRHVARLKADGALDETFLTRINDPFNLGAPVHQLAVQRDGKILVAGDFTAIHGAPRRGIARLHADGSLDKSFEPGTGFWSHPDPALAASVRMTMNGLAVAPDQKVYVAGTFRVFNGQALRHLVRLNPDGSLDQGFRAVTVAVNPALAPRAGINAIAVQWNGKLLVAGDFSEVNGVSRNRIARLLPNGEVDLDFVPPTELTGRGFSDAFATVAVQADGQVLVGGSFDRIGQTPQLGVMRLVGGDPGPPVAQAPVIVGDPVSRAIEQGESAGFEVLVSGEGPFTCQWRFNGADLPGQTNRAWVLENAQPSDAGSYSVKVDNAFGSVVSADAILIVKIPNTGDSQFQEQVADAPILTLVCEADGKTLAGGSFTNLNGVPRRGLARLAFDGALDESFAPVLIENDPETPASVRTVAQMPDGRIYIEGGFNRVGGEPRAMLARLLPNGELDRQFVPALADSHGWFALQPDGKILSGNPIVRLRLDGTVDPAWPAYPHGVEYMPDVVRAAVQEDGRVWAMKFYGWQVNPRRPFGYFFESWRIDGVSHSTFEGLPAGAGLGSPVTLLPSGDGRLLFLSSSASVALPRALGAYGPAGEPDPAFRRGLEPLQASVMAAGSDGRVVAGGDFTRIDEARHEKIARFFLDGTVDPEFTPRAQWESAPSALAVQPTGDVLAAGPVNIDGVIRWKVLRLYGDRTTRAPVIRSQPWGKTVLAGDPAALSIDVWAYPKAELQWQLNGTNLPGATSARLAWNEARLEHDGVYSVLVSNDAGSVVSASAKLTVLEPALPAIVSQPASQMAKRGSIVSFSVTATNFLELFYQWHRDGAPLPNQTNSTLSVTNVLTAAAYTVVVSNRVGAVTSDPARLTIIPEDPTPGSVDPSFFADSLSDPPGPSATISEATSVAVNSAGHIYLNLNLDVVRLFPDGALDPSFNPELGLAGGGQEWIGGRSIDYTTLDGLALQRDGKVLIHGVFTQVKGQPRNQLVRINVDGTLDGTFVANPGEVQGMLTGYWGPRVKGMRALSDGEVLISGATQYGADQVNLYKLKPDGQANPGMNLREVSSSLQVSGSSEITAVLEMPDSGLTAALAGSYSSTAGTKVFRVHADGTQNMEFKFAEFAGKTVLVKALALHPEGRILVGGSFESVNGTPCTNLARLNWNGTFDSTFAPSGLNGPVTGLLTQPDGKIIVIGGFDSCQGVPRNRIARLNGDGTLDTAFDPGTGPDGAVHSVALQADGHIVVGGFFTNFNGILRRRVARLFGGELPGVPAIQIQPESREVLAGRDTTLNVFVSSYEPAQYQWYFNGAAISNATNVSLLLSEITESAAGEYTVVASNASGSVTSRPIQLSIAALTPPSIVQQPANAFTIAGQTVDFTVVAESSVPLSYQWFHSGTAIAGATNSVLRLKEVQMTDAGRYSVSMSSVLGAAESRVAALSVDPGLHAGLPDLRFDPASWPVRFDPYKRDTTAAVDGQGRVLIGSHFLDENGASAGWLIRVNEDGTFDETFPRWMDASRPPSIAVLPDGKILLVLNGPESSELRRLNSDGSADPAFQAPDFQCNDLSIAARPDRKLMVSGSFGAVEGQPRKGLVLLGPDGALDTAFQLPAEFLGGKVMAVQSDEKALVWCNWDSKEALIRLNVDGSLDTSFAFDRSLIGSRLFAVAVQSDGRVLVGADKLMRLEPTGAVDASFVPYFGLSTAPAFYLMHVLVQPDGKILAASDFDSVNGVPRNSIARLNADGTLDTGFDPGSGIVERWITGMILAPNGDVVLVGNFTTFNKLRRERIVRLFGQDQLSRPCLSNSRWLPDGFEFQIQTEPGKVYVPEFKDLGADGSWQALPSFIGNGNPRAFCDTDTPGQGRIYRVRVD